MTDPKNSAEQIAGADTGYAGCYNCGKCTAGCPTAERMDLKPHQIMRLLQFDEMDAAVAASGPWHCVGCQTCLARCPNGVDIPLALSRLRHEAMARGWTEHAGSIPAFDDLFLGMIRRRGRVSDGALVMRLKLKAGGLTRDLGLGLKMARSGKIKLRAPRVRDTDSVQRLFEDETEAGP